jgi:hypothetical protein
MSEMQATPSDAAILSTRRVETPCQSSRHTAQASREGVAG